MENSASQTNSAAKTTPFNGRVSDAATSVHGAVDKVAATAESALRAATSAIDSAAASGHHAVDKVADSVKPTEQWIGEKTDALLAAKKNAVSDARQYIVTHPWQSLGVAILAGFLLGRRSA